jgi:hypothetical protein
VPFKVFAENPSRAGFIRMFERFCNDRNVGFEASMPEYLLDGYYRKHNVSPRACHPRDLITQAMLIAEYRGQPRTLTTELLDRACAHYFVEDDTEQVSA